MEITQGELEKIIYKSAKTAVKEVQKKKYRDISVYKRTEYILRNYKELKKAVDDNELTKQILNKVDVILTDLKSEPYYKVIEEYYMNSKKLEVIAGEWGVSIATIHTAKKILVEKISIRLFSDYIIKEIIKGE